MLDKILDQFRPEVKIALHTMGAIANAPAYATFVTSAYVLNRLAKSRPFRKAVIDASKKNINPKNLTVALGVIDQSLESEPKKVQSKRSPRRRLKR